MTSTLQHVSDLRTLAPNREAYIVGQDFEGHWLALEVHGRGGGIFRDRAAAVHFARFETDHRANAVRFSRKLLSLDFPDPGQIEAEPIRWAA